MFKRILVPVDGSELSFTAVSGATRFAKPLGSTIVLFTVIEPYSHTNLSEYRPESIEQYEERVEGEANKRLAQAKAICDEAGVVCSTVSVKSFSPAEAIIEQVDKSECDVVFMASRGRKGLAAVLLGSETQKVLTHSRIPVMVYS